MTATVNYTEDHPQISADGFTVVFAGAESEYFASVDFIGLPLPGLARSVLRLDSHRSDEVRAPLSIRDVHEHQPWAEGASSVVHPTVSADGERIVFDVIKPPDPLNLVCSGGGDPIELWLRETAPGSDRLLRRVCIVTTDPMDRGAGAVLSADGLFVFFTDTLQTPGGARRTLRREVDGVAECPFDVGSLGRTYSACSADGSAVIGVKQQLSNSDYLVQLGSGTCGAQTVTLAQGNGSSSRSADDATLSWNASRAAWTSVNNYATGGALPTWDIWVWFATVPDGWGGAPCPANADCTPSSAGGTLVRFVVPSLLDLDDRRPSITADGTRVFFICNGDYSPPSPGPLNGNGKAVLYVIDLDAPTWVAHQASSVAPADEDVLWASPDYEGATVAYSLLNGDFLDGHVDLNLVDVDFFGFGPQGGDVRGPAHLPFTAELGSCDVLDGTFVHATAELRQWRGGDRDVIVRFEVETDLGRVIMAGPFVQHLTDGSFVPQSHYIPFVQSADGTPLECRVFVMDGGAVQIDMANDAMAAQ